MKLSLLYKTSTMYKHFMSYFNIVFADFPMISDRLPKILRKLLEGHRIELWKISGDYQKCANDICARGIVFHRFAATRYSTNFLYQ